MWPEVRVLKHPSNSVVCKPLMNLTILTKKCDQIMMCSREVIDDMIEKGNINRAITALLFFSSICYRKRSPPISSRTKSGSGQPAISMALTLGNNLLINLFVWVNTWITNAYFPFGWNDQPQDFGLKTRWNTKIKMVLGNTKYRNMWRIVSSSKHWVPATKE